MATNLEDNRLLADNEPSAVTAGTGLSPIGCAMVICCAPGWAPPVASGPGHHAACRDTSYGQLSLTVMAS